MDIDVNRSSPYEDEQSESQQNHPENETNQENQNQNQKKLSPSKQKEERKASENRNSPQFDSGLVKYADPRKKKAEHQQSSPREEKNLSPKSQTPVSPIPGENLSDNEPVTASEIKNYRKRKLPSATDESVKSTREKKRASKVPRSGRLSPVNRKLSHESEEELEQGEEWQQRERVRERSAFSARRNERGSRRSHSHSQEDDADVHPEYDNVRRDRESEGYKKKSPPRQGEDNFEIRERRERPGDEQRNGYKRQFEEDNSDKADPSWKRKAYDPEDEEKEKLEILKKLYEFQKQYPSLKVRCTNRSSIADLREELKQKELEHETLSTGDTLNIYKTVLITLLTTMENVNEKYNKWGFPKLRGWSMSVAANSDQFNSPLLGIHKMIGNRFQNMNPFLQLSAALFISMMAYHMSESMFESTNASFKPPMPGGGGGEANNPHTTGLWMPPPPPPPSVSFSTSSQGTPFVVPPPSRHPVAIAYQQRPSLPISPPLSSPPSEARSQDGEHKQNQTNDEESRRVYLKPTPSQKKTPKTPKTPKKQQRSPREETKENELTINI